MTRQLTVAMQIEIAEQSNTEHRRDGNALEQPEVLGKIRMIPSSLSTGSATRADVVRKSEESIKE